MTYHLLNSHDGSAGSPSFAGPFEDLIGRFHAASMVEKGQTEKCLARILPDEDKTRASFLIGSQPRLEVAFISDPPISNQADPT
jgi:hypothetical protein